MPLAAQALVDLVQVLAHIGLLGLGDAAAVRLAGVLGAGVIDLAMPAATTTARPPGRRGLAPTLVLGRDGAEQDRLHVVVLGEAVEGFLQHGQLLRPTAARRRPAQAHDPVSGLKPFELVGEDFQAGRLANLGVLKHL